MRLRRHPLRCFCHLHLHVLTISSNAYVAFQACSRVFRAACFLCFNCMFKDQKTGPPVVIGALGVNILLQVLRDWFYVAVLVHLGPIALWSVCMSLGYINYFVLLTHPYHLLFYSYIPIAFSSLPSFHCSYLHTSLPLYAASMKTVRFLLSKSC